MNTQQQQTVDPYVNTQGEDWRDFPCYYVSAIDGPQWWALAGPYRSHQAALDHVERVRALANAEEPRSHFYGFGTVKLRTGHYIAPVTRREQAAETVTP